VCGAGVAGSGEGGAGAVDDFGLEELADSGVEAGQHRVFS
jgi:hypothetical protein